MRCAPSIGGKQRKYSQFKSQNLLSEGNSIKEVNSFCDQNSKYDFLSAQILEEK